MVQNDYSLFLGGAQKADLEQAVDGAETMEEFGRKHGVGFAGYVIEYRMGVEEDVRIISLLMQPATERLYECLCMSNPDKKPMHIFPGRTSYLLSRLVYTCPCNAAYFGDYLK